VDTVVPDEFISDIKGNELEAYKLTSKTSATASPYSVIFFTVNPTSPTYPTEVGSSLRIYTCENLIKAATWSDTTSCIVATIARPCTLTTNDTVTLITINSGSSSNLFVMGSNVQIEIRDLKYKYLSSHSEFIYQFYFELVLSASTSNAAFRRTVHTPLVIAERPGVGVDTGFRNYFSNDLLNSGSNYPNLIRIVSEDTTKWNYIVQST
jgi:hypothetical protein